MIFADDAWLSGFIDGEGCFQYSTHKRCGVMVRRPRLTIGLRFDDVEILQQLQAEFGGSLNDNMHSFGKGHAFKWTIQGENLLQIVKYLERFPLRAKKRLQYEEWLEEFWPFLSRFEEEALR